MGPNRLARHMQFRKNDRHNNNIQSMHVARRKSATNCRKFKIEIQFRKLQEKKNKQKQKTKTKQLFILSLRVSFFFSSSTRLLHSRVCVFCCILRRKKKSHILRSMIVFPINGIVYCNLNNFCFTLCVYLLHGAVHAIEPGRQAGRQSGN